MTSFFHPTFVSAIPGSVDFQYQSALNTAKLNVKFVVYRLLHEGAWEGSCRWGKLENMTYEAEKTNLDNALNNFKKNQSRFQFFPEMEILEPVEVYSFAEEGNPYIGFPDDQMEILVPDNEKVDVYVLMGGGPAIEIAKRFNKPIIVANTPGWGAGYIASLRKNGYEGYLAQNDVMLKDILNLMFVRKAIANTKVLAVTPSLYGLEIPGDLVVLKEKFGIDNQCIGYDAFFKTMDEVERDKELQKMAKDIGKTLLENAKYSNMKLDDIINSVQFYQTTSRFLEEYSCNAFTIGCFDLCSSLQPSKRRFTPCLCHALLKDIGLPSSCEGDINTLMFMMVQMYTSRKAAYMGNQDVDLSENTLRIHHSVASLKMNGLSDPETPYDIVSFTNSGFGVTLRHDFRDNLDREMTIGKFNPFFDKLLLTRGSIIDGVSGTGCGCQQSVTLKIPDGKELYDKLQDYGNHMSLVYGDYYQQIKDLGKLMGYETEGIV